MFLQNRNSKTRFEWSDTSRNIQQFWVSVSRYDYKVFPLTRAIIDTPKYFQFEGATKSDKTGKFEVYGEIEIYDPELGLEWYCGDWKKTPDHVEGNCSLSSDDDPAKPDIFYPTLYCRRETLDVVFNAFMIGFSSEKGDIGIEISLSYPDDTGQEFWEDNWRDKTLLVNSWKVFSGASA